MKNLYLHLRNRKREKDTCSGKTQFHGRLVKETKEIRSEETWGWIRTFYLNKKMGGLIFAAQEALRNKLDKKKH